MTQMELVDISQKLLAAKSRQSAWNDEQFDVCLHRIRSGLQGEIDSYDAEHSRWVVVRKPNADAALCRTIPIAIFRSTESHTVSDICSEFDVEAIIEDNFAQKKYWIGYRIAEKTLGQDAVKFNELKDPISLNHLCPMPPIVDLSKYFLEAFEIKRSWSRLLLQALVGQVCQALEPMSVEENFEEIIDDLENWVDVRYRNEILVRMCVAIPLAFVCSEGYEQLRQHFVDARVLAVRVDGFIEQNYYVHPEVLAKIFGGSPQKYDDREQAATMSLQDIWYYTVN
jgi:hypothetical protein